MTLTTIQKTRIHTQTKTEMETTRGHACGGVGRGSWWIYRPDESVWLHTKVCVQGACSRNEKTNKRYKEVREACLKPDVQSLDAGETQKISLQCGKGLRTDERKSSVSELCQPSSWTISTNAEVFNASHKPLYKLLVKSHFHSFLNQDVLSFFLINLNPKFLGLWCQLWFMYVTLRRHGPALTSCSIFLPNHASL